MTAAAKMTPAMLLAAAMTRVTFSRGGFAPYFGAVLRGMLRREMTPEMTAALAARGGATLAVTKDGVLYYSPQYVERRPVDELAFDLMHEAKHLLLGHFARAERLGAPIEHSFLVNLAQDMCINEGLREVPTLASLGKDAVYPETFKQPPKLIWEERYRLLLKSAKDAPSLSGVGRGSCGGCSGVAIPGEPQGEGRSEAQIERLKREVAEAIKEHQQKNGIGSVPGDLAVWADTILQPPKVDWRTKLATLLPRMIATRPGAVLATYHRPSRRQAGLGYGVGRPVMTGMCAPQPRVAVVVDTSGSMIGAPLKAAAAELSGILQSAGANITVCTVDAAVHGLREVSSINQALEMLRGGGGTDMRPGIDGLLARVPQPEVVICLTDGFIPHPGEEPPFRMIWCVVRGNPSDVYVAPWGEVVMVDEREGA